ncbi:MAG: hypothetical protein ACI93N_000953 [Flavobacteriaceae bacterium]|jgi:hypothetical protein
MELDFINNVNEFDESVVRLYNFNKEEAILFRDLIKNVVIENKTRLDLSKVPFIENRNCNLILGHFKTDEGILSSDHKTFYCALTKEAYITMINLLEPFCTKETKGYQYLYDIDNPIDFLFSPAGTW